MPDVHPRNQYLVRRGKRSTYYYNRAVPPDLREAYGRTRVNVSLGTSDQVEARKRRDAHTRVVEAEWDRLREALQPPPLSERILMEAEANREAQRAADERRAATAEAKVQDAAMRAAIAHQLLVAAAYSNGKIAPPKTIPPSPGLVAAKEQLKIPQREPTVTPEFNAAVDRVVALAKQRLPPAQRTNAKAFKASMQRVMETTEEGQAIVAYHRAMEDRPSYVSLGNEFLERSKRSKSTRGEYARGYRRADQYRLPAMDDVKRETAKAFLQRIADEEGLSDKSIGNIATALSCLWEHHSRDRILWRGINVETTHTARDRLPWTENELWAFLKVTEGHWLHDAITIALHSGGRLRAVSATEYDERRDIYWMPKLKGEAEERFLPCPSGMRDAVRRWVTGGNRKAASTIGNEFRRVRDTILNLKPDSDGPLRDFHSLRSNAQLHLRSKKLDPSTINLLTGRAGLSIADRRYSFGSLPMDAVSLIEGQRVYVDVIDWSGLYGPAPPDEVGSAPALP